MTSKPDQNAPDSWKAWFERSEEDYLLAQASMRRKSPLTYGATFHAQQCIEKYLKGILISRKIEFPRTHDLAALGYLCEQAGIILPMGDDDLERITAYAVETRYPGTRPSIEEAKQALKVARILRRYIKRTFSM